LDFEAKKPGPKMRISTESLFIDESYWILAQW